MTSKSVESFEDRGEDHPSPVARALFKIALRKQTTLVVSADVTTTQELLDLTDKVGPYIAVLKTHIDIIRDFSLATTQGLLDLKRKHDFLIFEDRKFVDIGNTAKLQYHDGALRISEWADIVNCTMLSGPGIVGALQETASSLKDPNGETVPRALLILATMTSEENLATGDYTVASIDAARKDPNFVLGFVSTSRLNDVKVSTQAGKNEDFVVFTTGVKVDTEGDGLGQQYQTPQDAVKGGADFIIVGRGIYEDKDKDKNKVKIKSKDQIEEAAKLYRELGWQAYTERVRSGSQGK